MSRVDSLKRIWPTPTDIVERDTEQDRGGAWVIGFLPWQGASWVIGALRTVRTALVKGPTTGLSTTAVSK